MTVCFIETENLAAGKATAASPQCCDGASANAVDGNRNPWHDANGLCVHTQKYNPSWWRVDLGSDPVPVSDVFLVTRFSIWPGVRDRSKDLKITLGEYVNRVQLTTANTNTI